MAHYRMMLKGKGDSQADPAYESVLTSFIMIRLEGERLFEMVFDLAFQLRLPTLNQV